MPLTSNNWTSLTLAAALLYGRPNDNVDVPSFILKVDNAEAVPGADGK